MAIDVREELISQINRIGVGAQTLGPVECVHPHIVSDITVTIRDTEFSWTGGIVDALNRMRSIPTRGGFDAFWLKFWGDRNV